MTIEKGYKMGAKKNIIIVNGGMLLIVGGIMYTGYLELVIFPICAIISCGVCLSICGLLGMISKSK